MTTKKPEHRYWVFTGSIDYIFDGNEALKTSFKTKEEADAFVKKEFAEKEWSNWSQIYDSEKGFFFTREFNT